MNAFVFFLKPLQGSINNIFFNMFLKGKRKLKTNTFLNGQQFPKFLKIDSYSA